MSMLSGAMVCMLFAVACVVQSVDTILGHRQAAASFCGTCSASILARLGAPLEHTLSLGVLSLGFALVALIGAIRAFNASRPTAH